MHVQMLDFSTVHSCEPCWRWPICLIVARFRVRKRLKVSSVLIYLR